MYKHLCTHTYKYGYSLKNTPLVISFFSSVHSDSINHNIPLPWGQSLQDISKRVSYLKPLLKSFWASDFFLLKRLQRVVLSHALRVSIYCKEPSAFPLSWLFSGIDPCSEPISTPWSQDQGFCFSFLNNFLYSRAGKQNKNVSVEDVL